jgi:hypothetical protein
VIINRALAKLTPAEIAVLRAKRYWSVEQDLDDVRALGLTAALQAEGSLLKKRLLWDDKTLSNIGMDVADAVTRPEATYEAHEKRSRGSR